MSQREFRAEFKEMLGLVLALVVIAALSLGAGVSSGDARFVAVGFFVLSFLLVVRVRFRVIVDNESIRSRGFGAEKSVCFDRIIRFEPLARRGYFAGRFYGPNTYEIVDGTQSLRINFKLFSEDCWEVISERVAVATHR